MGEQEQAGVWVEVATQTEQEPGEKQIPVSQEQQN